MHDTYHISHLCEQVRHHPHKYNELHAHLARCLYGYLDLGERGSRSAFRHMLYHYMGAKTLFAILYIIEYNETRLEALNEQLADLSEGRELLPSRADLFAMFCEALHQAYEAYCALGAEFHRTNGLVVSLVGQGITSAINMAVNKPEDGCNAGELGSIDSEHIIEIAVKSIDRLVLFYGPSAQLYLSALEIACLAKSEVLVSRYANRLIELDPEISDTYSGADMPKHKNIREDKQFHWMLYHSRAAKELPGNPFNVELESEGGSDD